jgi:RNA polymerase sigma-70 factor (ECF subfamily)
VGRRQLNGTLERIYRDEYPRFLRVATAVVGDEASAHDVVQEAFARAIQSAASYRGEGPLEGWLWRVLVNAASAARARTRAVADELPADIEAPDNPTDEYGVRDWVAALPERQRLAIFLRYYADLDYRAIAEALDVEIGTVSATLSAAHTALRRSLTEVGR